MTTYTGAAFEIEFFLRMGEWAKAMKEGRDPGPDPRGGWECHHNASRTSGWVDGLVFDGNPSFTSETVYRWKPAKPRTVTIDGVELVAPEREALAVGTVFYTEAYAGNEPNRQVWAHEDEICNFLLKNGNVFLTREAAQAMADVQRKQRTGE